MGYDFLLGFPYIFPFFHPRIQEGGGKTSIQRVIGRRNSESFAQKTQAIMEINRTEVKSNRRIEARLVERDNAILECRDTVRLIKSLKRLRLAAEIAKALRHTDCETDLRHTGSLMNIS
ncbi:uncharacterized protein LOC117604560 [Osmia lignaria lignaria]|uniref:uncharacterized protein LOC117604560 n=1 Tax=Osmia lignaria lignaria TaxID=1437193 RepID=UPI00402BC083